MKYRNRNGSRSWHGPRFFYALAALIPLPLLVLCVSLVWSGQADAAKYYPGTLEIVSRSSSGMQGTGASTDASISANGRYVTFTSAATNLVSGDINHQPDVFRKDMQSGAIALVDTDSAGNQLSAANAPSMSADGNLIAFVSSGNLIVKNMTTGIASPACSDSSGKAVDATCSYPTISPDGRYVSFKSDATNLVPDDTNGSFDYFVKDTVSGTVTRVSTDSGGRQVTPATDNGLYDTSISADDRYVVFSENASTLVYNDNNNTDDVFVKDMTTGDTVRVSTDSAGNELPQGGTEGVISGDGHHVAFYSAGKILEKDLQTGELAQVSSGIVLGSVPQLLRPSLSADGRYVAYTLYTADAAQDIIVKDMATGNITGATTDGSGNPSNGASGWPAVSADGKYVAFDSQGSNLVIGDGNNAADVFRAGLNWQSSLPTDYYFSWYDNFYGQTWLLHSQPGGTGGNTFDDYLGSNPLGGPVAAAEATTVPQQFGGKVGGPVRVRAENGGPSAGQSLVSERSLFGNSFEEIWSRQDDDLDSTYYWPSYTGTSQGSPWLPPGTPMAEWVLVANPAQNAETINVRITYYVNNLTPVVWQQSLTPGQVQTPNFGAIKAHAVKVQGFIGSDPNSPANQRKVIASERILMNGAFNEMPGIGAATLSSDYFWTWYDNQNAYSDAVAVGNPNDNMAVFASIYIAGQKVAGPQAISGHDVWYWSSPVARMDGPVEVRGCYDTSDPCSNPAAVYASQTSVFGPALEEIAGIPSSSLKPTANWTWYDEKSAGSLNWVLVANPNQSQIYYEISMPGIDTANNPQAHGFLASGQRVTPRFPGVMGGPVRVSAWTDASRTTPANVMSSQRVLWNGYFNEVAGMAQ